MDDERLAVGDWSIGWMCLSTARRSIEADRTGCDARLTTHDQDAIDACHRELLDVSCEALCLEGADPCLALFEQDPAAEPPVVHCDHPWRRPAID